MGDDLDQGGAPLESGLEDAERGDKAAPLTTTRDGDATWMALARSSYESSEQWFGASMRATLERALANFASRHPPGSKYHTEQYLKKSRIFRPKTRGAIRRAEAGHALAFFSTQDVVHCSAVNEANDLHRLAADIQNALLNERLNNPKQFWFKTLIGGAQDAMTTGVVISKQFWEYEDTDLEIEHTYESELEGRLIQFSERTTEKRVLKDQPVCRIIPIENLRLSPAASWLDPVNTSPYLIELQPTYVYEIKAKMERGQYRKLDPRVLAAASRDDWDSIRKAREGGRLDKYDVDTATNDFRSVWVRHNIIHKDGQDWVYDTLGEMLLMDPVAIEDYYWHAQTYDRPYAIGCAIIEAHKNYPGGIPQLIEDLQEEANDIANLRIDNVRAALNPRWLVRRGSGVDARGLIRNVPSGVTYANNITTDVKEIRAQDVTRSAYEEQNRLDLDIDGVVGTFNGSSVQANREVGKTVGGMNLLNSDASRLEEYLIRTVSETWVEHVMSQFVKLEAAYESDDKILQVVADTVKAPLELVLKALTQPVNVNVNVGFNATNPQKRIDKLSIGLATISAYSPVTAQQLDPLELVKEVFGTLGYKDGLRFFPALKNGTEDPRIQQLQSQIQQLQQQLEGKTVEAKSRVDVANINAGAKMGTAKMAQDVKTLEIQLNAAHANLQSQIDQVDVQLRMEESDVKRKELYLAREALSHEIQDSDRQFALEIAKLKQADEHHKRDSAAKAASGPGKPGGAPQGPKALPAPPTGGNDLAGTLMRDRYGAVPGVADGVSAP